MTKDCEGGNACHVRYIGGSKIPSCTPSDKVVVPVILTGGIKGSFVERVYLLLLVNSH